MSEKKFDTEAAYARFCNEQMDRGVFEESKEYHKALREIERLQVVLEAARERLLSVRALSLVT